MKIGLLLALLCGALALSAAPARAQSSVTTIGAGPAQACYQAARAGSSGLAALRDCDAALDDFSLNDADRAATFTNRGVLRLQRREAPAALADFDASLALDASRGEPHVNRGAALILLGRAQDAISAIDAGLALGTADPHEAYFNRAIAREELGDVVGAYRDYSRAAALAPEWDLPQLELARFSVERR
jgi:tetratricopeptide (TPR) repeat protein